MQNILAWPVGITHLLCFNSVRGVFSDTYGSTPSAADDMAALRETSEKVKYIEASNAREETNIHIVWEDWLWDCLSMGGRYEETDYKVGIITKKQAWETSQARSKARGKFLF